MKKIVPFDEVKRRLFGIHGDAVNIIESTYVGTSKKATFSDVEFGAWEAYVSNVLVGHSHPERGKKKSQATCLKLYGSSTPLGSDRVRDKIKNTCLEKYGVENPLGSVNVREKVKRSMLASYGVDNPQKSDQIKEKTRNTVILRYGKGRENIVAKSVATCIDRYGVKNPMQLMSVREKSKQTCMQKYGVQNPAQHPKFFQSLMKRMRRSTVVNHWKTGEELCCVGSYELSTVRWFNQNYVDFDWQVQFLIPESQNASIAGRTYTVDAYIKSGEHAGKFIEIKGRWMQEISKLKWEWFNREHPNSELWTFDALKMNGIMNTKNGKN